MRRNMIILVIVLVAILEPIGSLLSNVVANSIHLPFLVAFGLYTMAVLGGGGCGLWLTLKSEKPSLGSLTGEPLPQLASEYGLKLVSQLNPYDYLARYVDVYQPRHELKTNADADMIARDTLRIAATASDEQTEASLGILVIGRPTLGKTRCAWEAMRAALPKATFVRWPHGEAHPFDYASQQSKVLALWLDDLHTYATDREAAILLDLPYRLARSRLVIVATCRDAQEETTAREKLGRLIRRLRVIRLADLTSNEATQLANELEMRNVNVDRKAAKDGTAGAMLLDVGAMRNERYPRLPDDAKVALKTMKLLQSALTYNYHATRVIAIANAVFGRLLDAGAWRTVETSLTQTGFVRLEPSDTQGRHALKPLSDVYLERAIPDYPLEGAALIDDWLALGQAFEEQHDVEGLIALGNAFGLQKHYAEALITYEQVLSQNSSLAAAWNGKALALAGLAHYAEAVDASEQALALNPNLAEAWSTKAIAFAGVYQSELSRYGEIVDACEQALALNPIFIGAWETKAVALISLDRYKEALGACEQVLTLAIDLTPSSLTLTWRIKSSALFHLKRYAEALDASEKTLSLDPDLIEMWYVKAGTLLALKRYKDALEASEQLLAFNPSSAVIWDVKGEILCFLGQYAEALTSYERALSFDSKYIPAWNNKVALLKRLGLQAEARRTEQQRDSSHKSI